MKSVPRIFVWKVENDRDVLRTPSGLIVAERGAVVAVAVEDTFGTASKLLETFGTASKLLEAFAEYEIKPEPDSGR